MQMTFRWYGEGNDRIKLSDIKQIPGVTGREIRHIVAHKCVEQCKITTHGQLVRVLLS